MFHSIVLAKVGHIFLWANRKQTQNRSYILTNLMLGIPKPLP